MTRSQTVSKASDWSTVQGGEQSHWLTPAPECYYLSRRWKEQGSRSVLDHGCGLGRHAIFLAREGFESSAFDLSDESSKHVGEYAAKENLVVSCRTGDMLELPYADETFDAIVSFDAIQHQDTTGVKKSISEIRRVLKPGGECFITLGSKAGWAWQYDFPMVDENTKLCQDPGGPEHNVPHFFADDDQIGGLFEDFEIVGMSHAQRFYRGRHAFHLREVKGCPGLLSGGWYYHILVRKI